MVGTRDREGEIFISNVPSKICHSFCHGGHNNTSKRQIWHRGVLCWSGRFRESTYALWHHNLVSVTRGRYAELEKYTLTFTNDDVSGTVWLVVWYMLQCLSRRGRSVFPSLSLRNYRFSSRTNTQCCRRVPTHMEEKTESTPLSCFDILRLDLCTARSEVVRGKPNYRSGERKLTLTLE